MDNRKNILEIKNMHTYFYTDNGVVKSVDGVDIELKEGSTLGIVGESGSGKSVTALSVMGLLMGTTGKVVDGEIILDGKDITHLSDEERRKIRGNQISMIFQEPMTSLNPVMKIGDQIVEAIRMHQDKSKAEARKMAVEMLKKTGLPRAERMVDEYPFQLSGGQRQRVMIAMALVCNPKILIADEPTTALDVTIQAQIIDLMNHLKEEIGTSIIFITHDLGVVAETCDDVVVMYCGRVVEKGNVYDIFDRTAHPYTEGLLNSIPKLGQHVEELASIPGNVPNPKYMPKGCKFAPRCPYATERCREEEPGFFDVGDGHLSRCWRCEK
ncbi:MAG: ABC transporter ATP-binding protein [Candidatus Avilachnospira sp.]|jgi:peptide/nickel transport system ATP-binding protein